MNNKFLVGFLVLLVGVGVGWYILGASKPKEEGTEKTESSAMPVPGTTGVEEMVVSETTPASGAGGEEKGGVMMRTVVTYTESGFAPKEVIVKKGSTVTFMNESSGGMWVASAPHPTHSIYPEFDQLKSVAKGGSYEFTFTKIGIWKYHNHINASDTGTVIVTE